MNDEQILSIGTMFIAMIVLTVGLFAVTNQRDELRKEMNDLKQQAVDKGFAQWVVKGYNDTEFKWKE